MLAYVIDTLSGETRNLISLDYKQLHFPPDSYPVSVYLFSKREWLGTSGARGEWRQEYIFPSPFPVIPRALCSLQAILASKTNEQRLVTSLLFPSLIRRTSETKIDVARKLGRRRLRGAPLSFARFTDRLSWVQATARSPDWLRGTCYSIERQLWHRAQIFDRTLLQKSMEQNGRLNHVFFSFGCGIDQS